ncbi:HlyD family efflux transporter periplasmic adaptor subunit [Candidatus Binatia bacterium]|nr:HlyD family efflux transporter periplasmic adaptor subunit [Candidatus Binatia bacterium]
MAGWRRWIPIGVVVVGAGAGTAVLLRPRPVRVDVAVAARGPLRVTIDEDGETRVRERFVVAAPVAGHLARIDLKAGAEVRAGEVVARLDPLPLDPRSRAEARARLEAAEAAQREATARVAQARASLEQATRSARRARKLAKPGTISPEELELAELAETTRQKEVEAALFAASVAAHNVDAARAVLLAPDGATAARCGSEPCVEVRSPISGRVLRVAEPSERVVPVGTPLLEIGDPMALEVVVDVLSADAVKVHPGAEVVFEDWGGERTLPGRVRLVEPSGFTKVSALGVEEQRVNVIADFAEPPAALADGYRLEARIVVWEGQGVLTIPASALFRRGGQWEVFAVVDGYARRRPVQVGHRTPQMVEVNGGLQAEDVVVLHPSDLVGDGTRVTAAN